MIGSCWLDPYLEAKQRSYNRPDLRSDLMKVTESRVVAEARRVAKGQLSFFNRMMAAKTASASSSAPGVEASSGKPKKSASTKK